MSNKLLPVESPGTEITRFNALQHGILSRYTVLPWENAEEYQILLGSLVTEHTPQGPTEEHLVEELAGIIWRKRRLRLAEAAAHRRGLEDTLAPFRDTVKGVVGGPAHPRPRRFELRRRRGRRGTRHGRCGLSARFPRTGSPALVREPE